MILKCLALGGWLLAVAQTVGAQARLEGLERVYFDHVAGSGMHSATTQQALPAALPETLSQPDFSTSGQPATETDEAITVRDFRIAVEPRARFMWLREVSDSHHPRIAQLWWALYDEGRRTDVWHFAADPARTEGKALSNYLLDSVSVVNNEVVFRVNGTMFRPGGGWWIVRKDFSFKAGAGVIALDRVTDVFGFFHGYDKDGAAGDLTVTTEQPLQGRYELRRIRKVANEAAVACKFRDPDEFGVEWSTLESVARCLTGTPQAVVEYREFTASSGAERSLRKGGGVVESSPRK